MSDYSPNGNLSKNSDTIVTVHQAHHNVILKLTFDRITHMCTSLCCATEAWKKETWEDSEWGAVPCCGQLESVPPSLPLHRLYRLGHGPIHQEVLKNTSAQNIFKVQVYCVFTLKIRSSLWKRGKISWCDVSTLHKEKIEPLDKFVCL